MATKRAQYLPRNDVPPADEYEIDDIGIERDSLSEEEQELFTLIDGFNAQDPKSQIRVYESKTPGPNTRGQLPLAYLFAFTPGQLTAQQLMDRVNEEFGPGNYEAHIYAPHPNFDNRLKLARKIKFEIGATREEKEDELPFAIRRRRSRNGGNESPSEIMRTFAEMMTEQNSRTEALMREVLNRQAGPIQDPIAAMAQMMGIMLQFQQMMPKPQTTSLIDEVQKLAVLKEIFSDIGGGGDTSDNGVWVKMLEKFAPPLLNALSPPPQQVYSPNAPMMLPPGQPQPVQVQMQPRPSAPPIRNPDQAMRMPPPAQPQISAPTNPQQNPQPNKEHEMQASVNALVGFAKMGLSAEMVAARVLEATPEESEQQLYDFISADNCIEEMAKLNPAVNEYREFFEQLRAAILAEFTEEPEENAGLHTGDGDANLGEIAPDAAAIEAGKQT